MQILAVHGALLLPLNRQMSNKIETLLLPHDSTKQIADCSVKPIVKVQHNLQPFLRK